MKASRFLLVVAAALSLMVGTIGPATGVPGELTGTVILEGEGPLADVEVFLRDPSQGALFACTDQNGNFSFPNVADDEELIAATGPGTRGRCANWRFLAADGEELLAEFYDGHSGVAVFTEFRLADGPISFSVERAAGRPVCFGQLHNLPTAPTAGNDVLIGTPGADVIAGLGGNDRIVGRGGDDLLCGDSGWDTIYPGKGRDLVDGGIGSRDWVNYKPATRRVVVTLAKGWGAGQGRDTLLSIENIVGSAFGDLLIGNRRTNRILGGDGDDRLFGLAGHDRLWGQADDDELTGGAGADALFGGPGDDAANGGPGVDLCAAEVFTDCEKSP